MGLDSRAIKKFPRLNVPSVVSIMVRDAGLGEGRAYLGIAEGQNGDKGLFVGLALLYIG
jgi:hypothetical protein